MKKKIVATILVLLFLILLTGTALASPGGVQVQVPFKGSLQAFEIYDNTDFPIVHVVASGSGNATQLGRFTDTYTVDIHLNPDNSGTGTLYYQIVAANGDSLFSVAEGYGAPAPGIPNTNLVIEMHTITGGTGRFAGATGNFTIVRLVSNGITSGTFDGNIVLAPGN